MHATASPELTGCTPFDPSSIGRSSAAAALRGQPTSKRTRIQTLRLAGFFGSQDPSNLIRRCAKLELYHEMATGAAVSMGFSRATSLNAQEIGIASWACSKSHAQGVRTTGALGERGIADMSASASRNLSNIA